jgi:pantetheine-phosphate adenylyltransferase
MKTNDYLLSKYVNILTKIYNDHTVDDIISRWNEPHRYYHNINHLFFILNKIDNYFILEENEHLYMTDTYKNFIVAAFFHDIIYNPKSNNNEDKSIEYFLEVTNKDVHKLSSFYLNSIPVVVGMINCTKERKLPTDKFENLFWLFDNDILFNGTNTDLMDYENKIFKEFQFADYDDYKIKRLEFINNEMKYFESVGMDTNLSYLIPYIKNRKIKVGIYSGSFDPFHLGHMDVLQKASLVFDKVIVAYGNNPEKGIRTIEIPTALNYFQVDTFSGLITDYISSIENKNVDVTLVRGLRNGADLDYEANQLAFIKDIKPSVKVVYIPCDKKYEHISSSAIRNLEKFDKELAKKYLVQ